MVATVIVEPLALPELNWVSDYFRVYPNPVDEILNCIFNFSVNGNGEIQVFDLYGRLCVEQKFTEKEYQIKINTSTLSGGMYLVRYKKGPVTGSLKIIKK